MEIEGIMNYLRCKIIKKNVKINIAREPYRAICIRFYLR